MVSLTADKKIDGEKESFSDVLDVYKHLSDVKLRIENDVTSAFIMAKLGEKDKECVMEMTCNAYYSKDLIESIVYKARKLNYPMNKEEEKWLINRGKIVFDKYMRRIYMIVTLNRNIDGNYLVNVLSNYKKEETVETKELNKEGIIKTALAEKKPEDNKK